MLVRASALVLSCLLLPAAAISSPGVSEVGRLTAQADALVRMGVVEKGAGRSFDEASALLDEAEVRLAEAGYPPVVAEAHRLEIDLVREDLETLAELYEERFFGVFPLVRLTVPTLLAEEGLGLTEQLFHPPDVAAVVKATRRVAGRLGNYNYPYVVLTSSPANRNLENVATEELLRDGRSTPRGRKTVVSALTPEELAAFDRGELEPEIIDRLAAALDAVSILVLTIKQPVELEDAAIWTLHGDYFQPGTVIQGSPVDAPLFIRVESFFVSGFSQDRRDQLRPIFFFQLALLALALVWAAQVKWSRGRPFRIVVRLALGATLFAFGRIFAVLAIVVMTKFIPDSTDLATAAWWWPASLGWLFVLGGGTIAWIGQARLTNIVPGARGARAVGTIFALTAGGACSHFVAPLLMLDPEAGWGHLAALLLVAISLAVLFAFAVRTGPPVPQYFALGPFFVAPLVGISLMMASSTLLWLAVGSSAVLCLAAWIRHRVAVARGTEEAEPDPDEAAEIDREHLRKFEKRIHRKS